MRMQAMGGQLLEKLQTGHVGLNVSDLARAGAFYRQVFGFRVMGESREGGRKFLFLGDGRELQLTLWEQSEGRFERRKPGLHHLAFQVADIAQVREAERRLRALKVPFHYDGIVRQAEGSPATGVFFEDPDGTRLEIYCPSGGGDHPIPVPGVPSCGFF
ncbi:MAG: VOC family protein [Nitrospirota bacterium]